MKKLSILLAAAVLLATASFSQAQPIDLASGGVSTYFGFDNYENFVVSAANAANPDLAAGDQVEGILITKSIGTFSNPSLLNGQLATTDLYATFQLTIASVTGTIPLNGTPSTGTINFTLNTGDYLNFYTAANGTYAGVVNTPGISGATVISDLNTIGNGTAVTIGATTYAAGNLWTSTTGSNLLNSVTAVNSGTGGQVDNYSWANFTVNDTGYNFAPVSFGPYDNTTLTSTLFFQEIIDLNNTSLTGIPQSEFLFSSTDPGTLGPATPTPEPGTIVLMGAGLFGLGAFYRRKRA
jgi:hypothetical protein